MSTIRYILTEVAEGTGEHLEPESLALLAEGRLDAAERTRLLSHLNRCTECYEVFEGVLTDLEEVSAETVEEDSSRSWFRYAIAAGVVGVMLAGAGVLYKSPTTGPEQPRVAALERQAEVAPQVIASKPSVAVEDRAAAGTAPRDAVESAPTVAPEAPPKEAQPAQPAQPVRKLKMKKAPVMVASVALDADLKEVLLEDEQTTWTKQERIRRLMEALTKKGVQTGPVREVVMTAAYMPSKDLFGPPEKLKVRFENGVLYLEIVTEDEN